MASVEGNDGDTGVDQRVRVLLIDDSEISLEVVRMHLAEQGYEVQTCSAFRQADDLLKSWTPDIILVDFNMPDLDGGEVCSRLKASENTSQVPVMLVSSRSDSELKVLASKCGADGFLTKSRGLDELTQGIQSTLGS